jgi:hypothetical protein
MGSGLMGVSRYLLFDHDDNFYRWNLPVTSSAIIG